MTRSNAGSGEGVGVPLTCTRLVPSAQRAEELGDVVGNGGFVRLLAAGDANDDLLQRAQRPDDGEDWEKQKSDARAQGANPRFPLRSSAAMLNYRLTGTTG